jgi:hypothetical protein
MPGLYEVRRRRAQAVPLRRVPKPAVKGSVRRPDACKCVQLRRDKPAAAAATTGAVPAPAPRPALTPRVGESPDDNLPFLLDEEALRRSGGGGSSTAGGGFSTAAPDPQQAALRRSSFSAARAHAQPAPQQPAAAAAVVYGSGRAMSASPGELRRVSFDSARASPAGYSMGAHPCACCTMSHSPMLCRILLWGTLPCVQWKRCCAPSHSRCRVCGGPRVMPEQRCSSSSGLLSYVDATHLPGLQRQTFSCNS